MTTASKLIAVLACLSILALLTLTGVLVHRGIQTGFWGAAILYERDGRFYSTSRGGGPDILSQPAKEIPESTYRAYLSYEPYLDVLFPLGVLPGLVATGWAVFRHMVRHYSTAVAGTAGVTEKTHTDGHHC